MANRYKDLTGKRFSRLVVKCLQGTNKHGTKIWLCKCDCGNETTASSSSLVSNKVQSCGCLRNEKISKVTYSHGGTHTRLYAILNGMKGRCKDVKNPAYKYYGGKGVSICNEWLDFANFRDWALSNGYSDNLTIDRIDPNGNYEPNNCRWITMAEQLDNKTNSTKFDLDGELYTLRQISNIYGISYYNLVYRIKRQKWNVKDTIKHYKLKKEMKSE